MNTFNNPTKQVQDIHDLAPLLRQEGNRAEGLGKLTKTELNLIYQHKWFNLFVPKTLGGLELTLPEALRVEEELAYLDGSLGWTVTLCAGANLFVGYLDPVLVSRLFETQKVCFGGSGKVSGIAEIQEKGYLVSGVWDYATGSPHNTAFTANCYIHEGGKAMLNKEGEPLVKSFLFLRDEVQVIENWNAMGLRATASHRFQVNDLWIPQNRSFEIHPLSSKLPQLIYQYPFLPFAESTLAINFLGMTRKFLACCREIFLVRYGDPAENGPMQSAWQLWKQADQELQVRKKRLYQLVEDSWWELNTHAELKSSSQEQISAETKALVQFAKQEVIQLFPWCGMKGTDQGEEINRVFRDLFTAGQHALLLS